MLSYLGSVEQSLRRGDEPHLSVSLTCHENHSLRLYSADLPRGKVGENADLLPDHILRRIELGDAGDDRTLVNAGVDGQLQQLVSLGHTLSLKHGGRADIHLLEILESAFSLLRGHYLGGLSLCGSLALCPDGIKTGELGIDCLILNLGEEKLRLVQLVDGREKVSISET